MTHAMMVFNDKGAIEVLALGTFDDLKPRYLVLAAQIAGPWGVGPVEHMTNVAQAGERVMLVPLKDGWWDLYGAGREKVMALLVPEQTVDLERES